MKKWGQTRILTNRAPACSQRDAGLPECPLQLVKEFMKGNKGIFAEKEGVTAPFSSLIECLDFVEQSESGDREASEFPADNAIVEDEGFIVVGGIRLAINGMAA